MRPTYRLARGPLAAALAAVFALWPAEALPLATVADVSIEKSDDPDPVVVGKSLTYTVTVANGGPDAASAVSVADTLPAGTGFGSAVPSKGTCGGVAGGVVTCVLGSMAAGTNETVTIMVTPFVKGLITNQVSVATTSVDPVPVNNATAEPTVTTSSCNIIGTPGPDVLVGTPGPDIICGLDGSDTLDGLGDDDRLLGHAGNDILVGGAGEDRLEGSGGKDRLRGGGARDHLGGGAGTDRLVAGGSGDRLHGKRGNDMLRGGPGRDVLNGGPGFDRCIFEHREIRLGCE